MRFYCLSSIKIIPPKLYSIDFHEIYRKGRSFLPGINSCLDISYFDVHQSDFDNLNIYQLTEVTIGFIKPKDGSPDKEYVLNIYRRDLHFMGTLVIPLLPCTVELLESPANALKFRIPYSRICMEWEKQPYDLEIKLCCIKNTSVKQIISDNEESVYDQFVCDIEAYANGDSDLREDAFNHFHLVLPDTTEPKYLSEKIRKFKKYIEWCCHEENGSPKNVPNNSDYSQQLKSFLQQRDKWIITDSQSAVRSQFSSTHKNCRDISWNDPNITSLNLPNFKSKYLQKIKITNIDIMIHYELLKSCIIASSSQTKEISFGAESGKAISNIDFSNLTNLTLSSCQIYDLPEEIFSNLPTSLRSLELDDNYICYVPLSISRLTRLENVDLSFNHLLLDDGIPWDFLPKSIKKLDLSGTRITKIPAEIRELGRLEYLEASECSDLEFVSWKDISSKTIISISVGGGKALNTVNLLEKKKLKTLKIEESKLETFNDSLLPENLQNLSLRKNNLEEFNLIWANLKSLNLFKNNINNISWKSLPSSLTDLDLSQNNLSFIGDISHLFNLETLFANSNKIEFICKNNFGNLKALKILELANNYLGDLPTGFENIPNSISLDLSSNDFDACLADGLNQDLWHRIPKELIILRLDYNNLIELPCHLKNLKIKELFVKECNLLFMCTHIADNIPYIDIRGNPGITHLPFVSAVGHEIPTNSKQLMKLRNRQKNVLTLKTDNQDLRNTARIYEKNLKYTFRKVNMAFPCECCACCGEDTKEDVVQQVMIMDFYITFKSEKEIDADWLYVDGYPENLPLGYSPGKWKTNVITRLCKECIKELKIIQNGTDISEDNENDSDNLDTKRSKTTENMQLFFDVQIPKNPETLLGQVVQVYHEPQGDDFQNPDQNPNSLPFTTVPYQEPNHHFEQINDMKKTSLNDSDIQILDLQPHVPQNQQYQNHPVFAYNVPTIEWLQQTCTNLGIQFEYYMFHNIPYIPDLFNHSPEMIVQVESDGHCGFRALSILLSGNQNSHGILRQKIAETILSNNDPNFEKLLFFENSKANALVHLTLNPEAFCPSKYWMSCVHLSAAAYLLNANICVKPFNDAFGWRLYNSSTFLYGIQNTIFDYSIPTLLLDNSSQNHFNPVLTVKNNNENFLLQNPLNW